MKGIAEYGNSNYFYIDEFEKIELYVSAALGSLLGVIGKEATLKVRGKGGGVVKKIYGHDLLKVILESTLTILQEFVDLEIN